MTRRRLVQCGERTGVSLSYTPLLDGIFQTIQECAVHLANCCTLISEPVENGNLAEFSMFSE